MSRLFMFALLGLAVVGCAGLDLDEFSDSGPGPRPALTTAARSEAPSNAGAVTPVKVPVVEPLPIPEPTVEIAPPTPPESRTEPAISPGEAPPLPPLPIPDPQPEPTIDPAVAQVTIPPRSMPVPIPKAAPTPVSTHTSTGRVVAKVGDEAITLPELTDAVKARLALVPSDRPPARRQIITLARGVLESMIERSLVLQEARDRFPDEATLAQIDRQIRKRWDEQDLPLLLRHERVPDVMALETRLARRFLTIECLRERQRVREIGLELARRDPQATSTERTDLTTYLDRLRQRHPITSVLTPAEIAAAAGDPKARG